MGEHLPCKQGVESSNLLVSTAGNPQSRTLKTEYRDTDIRDPGRREDRRNGTEKITRTKEEMKERPRAPTLGGGGRGQAGKGAGRMPWHWEPMKDATSCEKLRGAAHTRRTAGV